MNRNEAIVFPQDASEGVAPDKSLIIFDLDGTLTPQRASSTTAFERHFIDGIRERRQELFAAGHTME